MIIADTNIVSEFMKDSPEPRVLAWAQALEATDLTISVVTVEEIDRGFGGILGGTHHDLDGRLSTSSAEAAQDHTRPPPRTSMKISRELWAQAGIAGRRSSTGS